MPNDKGPCPRCGDNDLTTKDNCPLDLGCPHKHPDGYRPASPVMDNEAEGLSEEQIKHMADRFLGWRLPENFSPDAGISFNPWFNVHTRHPMKHDPRGTNLLDAAQAAEMVRYMAKGLPAPSTPDEREVRFPTSAEEAAAMQALGHLYLQQHAPDRLTPDGLAADLTVLAGAILARRVVKITPAMIRVVAAVIPGPGAYDIAHDRLARALAIAALTKGAEHG